MFKHAICPLVAMLAMLALSAGCSKPAVGTSDGRPPSALETGARIYGGNCSPCHQQDARGIAGVYPSLVGSPVLLGDPLALARWVVKGERPASMPEGRYATKMQQFGWMKASDAAALFTFLRTSFGNDGSPVDAADIGAAFRP